MICELCNRVYVGSEFDELTSICTKCKNIIENVIVKETEMEKTEKSYQDRLEELYEAALVTNDLRIAYDVARELGSCSSAKVPLCEKGQANL